MLSILKTLRVDFSVSKNFVDRTNLDNSTYQSIFIIPNLVISFFIIYLFIYLSTYLCIYSLIYLWFYEKIKNDKVNALTN